MVATRLNDLELRCVDKAPGEKLDCLQDVAPGSG